MSQPLVNEYQKKAPALSPEKRFEILTKMKSRLHLSSIDIAKALTVQPQTVRCWLSESNPRNIPMELLSILCQFYGLDPREDFK